MCQKSCATVRVSKSTERKTQFKMKFRNQCIPLAIVFSGLLLKNSFAQLFGQFDQSSYFEFAVKLLSGDEGPVCGVAQGVDCHGVTVGHEEKGGRRGRAGSRERWRENTQGTLRMSMDGMTMEDKCERLEPCGM